MKVHSCVREETHFCCEECKKSGDLGWAIRHIVENQWNDKSFFTAVDQLAESTVSKAV
jgi:hypothetical protein